MEFMVCNEASATEKALMTRIRATKEEESNEVEKSKETPSDNP